MNTCLKCLLGACVLSVCLKCRTCKKPQKKEKKNCGLNSLCRPCCKCCCDPYRRWNYCNARDDDD